MMLLYERKLSTPVSQQREDQNGKLNEDDGLLQTAEEHVEEVIATRLKKDT